MSPQWSSTASIPRPRAGFAPDRTCRGWGLAAKRPGLTAAERRAGEAHVELCRHCRDRLAALERTRAQVLGSSAGVVGGVAGTQLLPWGSAAGAFVTGKLTTGVIAALGAAVLATGGAVAAGHQAGPGPATHRPAAGVTAPASPAPRPPAAVPAPGTEVSVTPTPSPTDGPSLLPRTPSTAAPSAVPVVPVLPKSPLLPRVPAVPLPSVPSLPLPLEPLDSAVHELLDD